MENSFFIRFSTLRIIHVNLATFEGIFLFWSVTHMEIKVSLVKTIIQKIKMGKWIFQSFQRSGYTCKFHMNMAISDKWGEGRLLHILNWE